MKMTFDEWFDGYPAIMPISEYDTAKAAWAEAIKQAIAVVETYRVSVGNSAAGEMAAEWTMENLREVRDELREMVPNVEFSGGAPLYGAASAGTQG
jgi:hypothetical protein